jgi:hypothetical protein
LSDRRLAVVSLSRIAFWDHWIAFGLLSLVGLHAIRAGLKGEEPGEAASDPTRGVSLVVLSLATSLDALAAGLSFAALGVRVWVPSLVIGCTAGADGRRHDVRQLAGAPFRAWPSRRRVVLDRDRVCPDHS